MIQWLISLLRRLPAWPMAALLLVGFLVCNMGFDWRSEQLGCDVKLLDVRGWYTPSEARDLLERLGEGGRSLYGATEVTLDFAFPLIYGSLFGLLILQLYSESAAKWLMSVPLIAVVADLFENGLAAYLAWTFDGQASAVAWAAAVFTAVKMSAFLGAVALILVGGAVGVVGKTRSGRDG